MYEEIQELKKRILKLEQFMVNKCDKNQVEEHSDTTYDACEICLNKEGMCCEACM